MRALFLLPGFLFAALPAAACDMDVRHRGQTVADYVEAVQPCLRTWPAGYMADARMEADFFTRVNEERTSRGLAALRFRPELLDAARFQSLDMAFNKFFGHESPDGRHHDARVAAFDRSALVEYSAENVAMVEVVGGRWNLKRRAVERLHDNLMDSPGHRANILNPDITDVAMGVVRTESGVWVTQVFLELSGSLPAPLPVRMHPGQRLDMRPALRGWSFQNFGAKQAGNRYTALGTAIPNNLTGDFELTANGRMNGELPGMFYTIRLPGPAVTVGRQGLEKSGDFGE
ncbi:CAP domain-containing protein [Hyphomonas sp.]|uniref:CAP domain-containing protein n=1 Tax=Hyphomonas sp. TaxID=87 RepID=UPI003528EEF0